MARLPPGSLLPVPMEDSMTRLRRELEVCSTRGLGIWGRDGLRLASAAGASWGHIQGTPVPVCHTLVQLAYKQAEMER